MTADRSTTPGLPHPQGIGEDPLYHFERVYLLFLQGLFAQFPSGSYRWTDGDDSEIAITSQVPLPVEQIEQRPAIVTMRGPAQFANIALDQLLDVDPRTGAKTHVDLVPLTMTVNCLAKVGPEAQRIGWIVMTHIRRFKTTLQRQGMHQVGEQLSIGAESPPGSLVQPEVDSEVVNIAVFSPFFFRWKEIVTPTDAPVADSIEARLDAGLGPAEAQTSANEEYMLKRPTIRGRPIEGRSVSISRPIKLTVKT